MKNPKKQRILVVDDEENLRHLLSILLRKHGYSVDTAPDGEAALRLLGQAEYDFVLSDILMPRMDGKTLLVELVDKGIDSTVIMMSAYGTIDTAIECMKLGAYDYISKPFKNDEIVLVLKKAEERERLKTENKLLKEEVSKSYCFANIVSKNRKMLEIFDLLKRLCDIKTTVMITGESGTGKELVARALHFEGSRKSKAFVAVNCAAIPESLLESELFGHVKGAFTDASTDKTGLFELADGGTLFLDEIGEMPASLQVKLLRVVQDEEIRRIGAATGKKVDVRVISATSRNLEHEIANGRFREDLYFRLNVFTIPLPPLRDRLDDLPLLIEHFLAKFSAKTGNDVNAISTEAVKCLVSYGWPGNIRELENVLERGVILCGSSKLGVAELSAKIVKADETKMFATAGNLSIKQVGEAMERELISRALEQTGGNRTHSAKILEISLRSLIYKIKEFGLE